MTTSTSRILVCIVTFCACFFSWSSSSMAAEYMHCQSDETYDFDEKVKVAMPISVGIHTLGQRQADVIQAIQEAKGTDKILSGNIQVGRLNNSDLYSFSGKIVDTRFLEVEKGSKKDEFIFLVDSPVSCSWFVLSTGEFGPWSFYGDLYFLEEIESFVFDTNKMDRTDQYIVNGSYSLLAGEYAAFFHHGTEQTAVFGRITGEVMSYEEVLFYEDYFWGLISKEVTETQYYLPFLSMDPYYTPQRIYEDTGFSIYNILEVL